MPPASPGRLTAFRYEWKRRQIVFWAPVARGSAARHHTSAERPPHNCSSIIHVFSLWMITLSGVVEVSFRFDGLRTWTTLNDLTDDGSLPRRCLRLVLADDRLVSLPHRRHYLVPSSVVEIDQFSDLSVELSPRWFVQFYACAHLNFKKRKGKKSKWGPGSSFPTDGAVDWLNTGPTDAEFIDDWSIASGIRLAICNRLSIIVEPNWFPCKLIFERNWYAFDKHR